MPLLALPARAEEAAFWGFGKDRMAYTGQLWRAELQDFSEASYDERVEQLLAAFEAATGKPLVPGRHGKAALKVDSAAGAGLHTPKALVRAVAAALLRRGFRAGDLCIVDAREDSLRAAGFLPPLSRVDLEGAFFQDIPVQALSTGTLRSPDWHYDSPLPREFTSPLGRELLRPVLQLDPEETRRSYLPKNLVTEVDFWINLPVAMHHPATGLSGALVNASLQNVTNSTRFFNSPANAPVAVAEIAAIPELQASWALNLVSLEQYQYIGGPVYNANYTASLPQLWLSVDPVIMDAHLVEVLNRSRRQTGFEELPELPEFVVYAMQLGLGQGVVSGGRVIDVPPRPDR